MNLGDARVLAASNFDCGGGAARVVLDVIVAHDPAEALVLRLVVRVAREGGLEAALSPVLRVLGFLTAATAHLILEAGAVLLELDEASVRNKAKQQRDHEFFRLHKLFNYYNNLGANL